MPLHPIEFGLGKYPGLHAIEFGHVAYPSYAATGAFTCDAAHFDDSEYMIGAIEFSDGTQFTATGFFKAASDTTGVVLFAAGDCFVTLEDSGIIGVYADATDFSAYIYATTTETFDDDAWHSIQVSLDTNYSAGNKKCHIVIDRTELVPTIDDTGAAFSIYLSDFEVYVGQNHPEGAYEVAEVTMEDTYIDFSVSSNIDKFVTASNKPANIGSDGSTAYGSAPAVYLHIDDGEAAANFATNRGSGSDFTISGTLSTAPTSPSD